MTVKQTDFITYYVNGARGNAAKAARFAGYSNAKVEGFRLKSNPTIWAEIQRQLKERILASEEVLERLTQHASASLEPFLYQSGDTTVIDLSTEQAKESIHLLKKVKCKKRTGGTDEEPWTEVETEIELHDPQAALVHLGRHHKLFTDKVEQSGTLSVSLLGTLTEAEIDARLSEQQH